MSTGQTQIHARTLRGLLESLDDIRRTRDDLVLRAERRAESDDIRPKVLTAAAKLEHRTEINPVMFEDVSDNELAKYDKFIQSLTEGRKKQEEILASIKVISMDVLSYLLAKTFLVHERRFHSV